MSIFSFNAVIQRMPKAFLITLLMIAFVESAIVYFDNVLYWDFWNGIMGKVKNEFSMMPGSHFDVLTFGDCYNQTGIFPEVFDHQTNLNSFNFSTDASRTVVSSYVMLKNYLKVNKPPKYIFIGFLPAVWTEKKTEVIRNSLWILSDFKKHNVKLFIKEFGLINTAKLFVPSLKHQDFWKKISLSEILFGVRYKEEIEEDVVGCLFRYRGALSPWGNAVNVVAPPNLEKCGTLTVSSFFKKYLEAILKLCQKSGIRVFYIMPAIPFEWADLTERCHDNDEIKDYLNSLKREYANLKILEPQEILKENKWYYNAQHLNYRGAVRLSSWLADVVRQENNNF